MRVRVLSRKDRRPVFGATVVAFTDFENSIGANGITDRRGIAELRFSNESRIERLYVYPQTGFWSLLRRNVALTPSTDVYLSPVNPGYCDGLRYFYGRGGDDAGKGVKVAVLDTGVGPHPDLFVEGGENTVVGEPPSDYGGNGLAHGTHVAGIISARGSLKGGLRGVAPGVALRSYRIYASGKGEASNYSLAKAIDRAAADKCDLLNLSLGVPLPDLAVQAAIEDAHAAGSIVIASTGNDGLQLTSYPASDPLTLAVSAIGRQGTFPRNSTGASDISQLSSIDAKNFFAAFSNSGAGVNLTGPGVDILSTVPDGYAPMSGTSMACPAVTGAAARLLALRPEILGMARDRSRSDRIIAAILESARSLGFGPDLEGRGLPCYPA